MSNDGKATGSCLCGAVKIKVTGSHGGVGVCHCAMCRRWGSGPTMAIEVGRDIEIEGRDHVATYRSSDWAERAFCQNCGSSLYYRVVETDDHFLSAGVLDDPGGLVLESQVFIDEKPDFYDFANDTQNMTGAELFAMYAPEAGETEEPER